MSDVREVSEWHEAMEGTFTVAGERLQDAINDMLWAMAESMRLHTILRWLGDRT